MISRILLALTKPETWYAILTGAGALGIPLAMLAAKIRRRGEAARYGAAWRAGYRAGLEDRAQ